MPRDAVIHCPTSRDEALDLLAEHVDEAKLIAGGTAFTILWRSGFIQAEHLISCARLSGLDGVEERDGRVVVGALTTLRDTEVAPLVRRRLPVIASALGLIANLRVRNVATWGGNLAEADSTADLPAALVALDAEVEISTRDATRTSTVADLIVDFFETTVAPEEMITAVRVPIPGPALGGSYVKFVSRNAEDRTCLGVAAFVEQAEDGTCIDLRVAAIGAAATPLRVREAEVALRGERLTPDLVADLAHTYVERSDPLSDARGTADYRKHVLPSLITESVARAERGENRAVLV
jgi:carbon-monoxide dehydrogenase medium subunit